MEAFLKELETLELSSKGQAKITGMSPEEFMLEICSSDNLGRMELEVQLHTHQYSGSNY